MVQWFKNLPANAGTWFDPWSGRKGPHTIEQLGPYTAAIEPVRWSLWATTPKPTLCNFWSPHAWSECFPTKETTAMRSPSTSAKSCHHSSQLDIKSMHDNENPEQPKVNKSKKNVPLNYISGCLLQQISLCCSFRGKAAKEVLEVMKRCHCGDDDK